MLLCVFIVTWRIAKYIFLLDYLESVFYHFRWNVETIPPYCILLSYNRLIYYIYVTLKTIRHCSNFCFQLSNTFERLSWTVITYIHPDTYHFCSSSLILDTLFVSEIISHLFDELLFVILSEQVCWQNF